MGAACQQTAREGDHAMTKKELDQKFPLHAPECPYCNKTTLRRRRFWEDCKTHFCKTPGCGAQCEVGRRESFRWSNFSNAVVTRFLPEER